MRMLLICLFYLNYVNADTYLCEKKTGEKRYQDFKCGKEEKETKIIFYHYLPDRAYQEYDFAKHEHVEVKRKKSKNKAVKKSKKKIKKKNKASVARKNGSSIPGKSKR